MAFARPKTTPGAYAKQYGIYKDKDGIFYYSDKKLNTKDTLVSAIGDAEDAFTRVSHLNKMKRRAKIAMDP